MPNGTPEAVTEAKRLTDIGFPEFTAKLVKDVFDALLAATLRQMEAYSELVAATAKTLDDYVAENKELVSGEEVWDWLVKNLPGPAASVTDPKPEDATLVRVGVSFDLSKNAEKAQLQKIHDKVNYPDPMPTSGSVTLDENAVNTITDKVRGIIAGNRYTLLKEMVRMGIIRLVVDYGEIETRLTFTTYGESLAQRTATSLNTRAFAATANLQTGKAINKWVKVSAAANYSSVSVRTTSSIDRDVSGSKVDIYARVFIRFKSDYQALGG
jgi:tRNA/tmRNA/rRNA uracil-C5-methylase (TrmA/RlmC/RlmD family)